MYIDQLNEGLACLPCHGGPATRLARGCPKVASRLFQDCLKVASWLCQGCPQVALRLPKSNINIIQKTNTTDVDRKFQISLNLKGRPIKTSFVQSWLTVCAITQKIVPFSTMHFNHSWPDAHKQIFFHLTMPLE